jgi:hypothetical protein
MNLDASETKQEEAGFAIPESVRQLKLDQLPITTRLANVARSIGVRTLGDLNGRSSSELLQYKDCGLRTLGEVRRLLERVISAEFNEAQIRQLPESTAVVELLTLLEQGIAKLSQREREFLLARMDGLILAEIGRRYGFTRARVHQVVAKALENLRKIWGPRVPRLLEMLKQRCLSIPNGSPMTLALLEQWIGDSSQSFQLSTEARLRLIAALDKNIPCRLESSPKTFGAGRNHKHS